MNILLLDKPQSEFLQLSGFLKENGHDLSIASDEVTAINSVKNKGIEMLMVAVRGGDENLVKVISDIKINEVSKGVQIALIGKDMPDDFLVKAYDAGADADIRMPFSASLLLSRLRAFDRIRNKSVKNVDKSLSNANGGEENNSYGSEPVDLVAKSESWKSIKNILKISASQFLTMPVSVNDYADSKINASHACQINLSNAKDQLEIRIALAADEKSACDLAIHLFGADGADLAPDMMSELANILMGSAKSAIAKDGITFTGGLPEVINAEQVIRPSVMFKYQAAIELNLGEAKIILHIGLRSKANLFVSSNGLREGMVIAKDIYNSRGLMVLKEGTRLSQNMIDHLRKFMTAKSTVEVMAP